ncbi:hypothetical protein FRC11_001044 [Ceratobasidium sp. 423]|nr:hypothetical protein FRC11_001044 [Ceratobasidium sp. 423]
MYSMPAIIKDLTLMTICSINDALQLWLTFQQKEKKANQQARPRSPPDTEGITPVDELDSDVVPEFRIRNLSVSPKCEPLLENIVPTHRFNPLMAFEFGSEHLLRLVEYRMKLRGVVVDRRFTLSRKVIKRPSGPTPHFTETIDEITILGMPKEVSLAPSKQQNRRLFCIQADGQQPASPEPSTEAGSGTTSTKHNREVESDTTNGQEEQGPETGPSTRLSKHTRK